LSPVVNVVFDEVFTLADPDSSWSERGIAVVFLASGGVGKAAKGIKLADDLLDGAKALDKMSDASRAAERAGDAGRGAGRAKNKLAPNPDAKGAHSVFTIDEETGNIRSYETYKRQTNAQNPNPWELEKRFDTGHGHYDKSTGKHIDPHVHDASSPSGVRPPKPWEIP
ncbi:MAG: hypothetical protein ACYC5A_11165, partial [Thermoleophilia bacterium]